MTIKHASFKKFRPDGTVFTYQRISGHFYEYPMIVWKVVFVRVDGKEYPV